MDRNALAAKIADNFAELPPELAAAARYIVDNPDDVALFSMREQARRAGVRPWTMTRLAKRLGHDGYDAIRAIHAEAIRQGDLGFAGRAGTQAARQAGTGDAAFAADIADTAAGQIGQLAAPATLEGMVTAASRLAAARRVYCLGLRSSHAVAAQFSYVLSFLGDRTTLLGADGFRGLDAIRMAGPQDALFAVSVAPYSRATIEATGWAADQGVPVVALTDSAVSPLATRADVSVIVATESPSFFHSMAPAFAVAEILAALIAGRGGAEALAAIAHAERQLADFGVHHQPLSKRTDP
ncbi:MurR/RpiR family transcriptional regulator [Nitratireductor mangrovi]|uniref:MurR/RpiR family transcriptional regulator n=1 Tax=Nitratireductor mangrovi TaxID=2599600 RepID=A0A5B8KXP4_9HYPH|nr:MurR/RpiR family transcriptional regulator [Nitratireductor mangrovi]QDZ00332.1 MurR/RpiR family transcriptional regulator [Nitratireductor mangrovi]